MKLFRLIFVALFLISCSRQPISLEKQQAENKKINEFFETTFMDSLKRHPEYATYVGLKLNYDKLEDISDEAEAAEFELTKQELKKLREFDFDALGDQEKISYRLFEDSITRQIRSWDYRFHYYPVNQMFGRHSGLPSFMINTHSIENYQDAKDYISRLSLFHDQLKELVKILETRKNKGIVAPSFIYPKAINDSKNIITGKPFTSKGQSPLYQDFLDKISKIKISKSQKSELLKQVEKSLLTSVKPGYELLISKLEELAKSAPTEGTATYLPDGDDFYENALEMRTTTKMSPSEIHELGLKQTARIHKEIKEIMSKVGFKGSLDEFFSFVKTDKQFRYPNTQKGKQQFLEDSRNTIKQMRKQLPKMFNLFPKAELTVKAVEPYREKSAGEAFYEGPSEDGKRPGIYYVNLHDMRQVAKHELEALAYHEGIPGHHMQIAITNELKDIPRFRKYNHYTAYVEGWGLYAEKFPKDFGFYKDPYSDFGRLTMELWRAGRLVVDTGLHNKGWSMDQAIAWLDKNTPSTHGENVRAIQRYVVMPGQATAYMIGMLKIIELKELAKNKLGDQFDIKDFHDQVLKNGPLPLSILEEEILNWIEQKKS